MSNMFFNIRRIGLLFCLIVTLFLFGCASKETARSEDPSLAADSTPMRDFEPMVLLPVSGENICENDTATLDISNTENGYILLTYHGTNEKVKFQISSPDQVTYTYPVSSYEEPMVFPLTGGDGDYAFSLLESVDPSSDRYAVVFSEETSVALTDTFLPFLTPNVYCSFTDSSTSVTAGSELAKNCCTDLDVISNIYHYVIETIVYDEAQAKSVTYGYIPDPDRTLASQKGICFDYASLMTAMLRSQRIPTRLEVGYVKDIYHAWISCYIAEIGWVDHIIEFDGENWSLVDPTLAAGNDRTAVQEFIGDGSSYLVKYTY